MADNGDRVNWVIAEYLRRIDSGTTVDPQEVIDAHPDLTDELRSYFEMAGLLDRAVQQMQTVGVEADSTLTGSPPSPSGYEIRGELGRGGMGVVYRAFQERTQREVALKVLPPALAYDPLRLMRFKREAEAASQLTSSHVLPVYDVIEDRGAPLIVMPCIDGADLGQILRQRRAAAEGTALQDTHPWTALDQQAWVQKVLAMADQVIQAVAAIHEAGILHRDIKPSNILIDREGNAWLSDFGLARFAEEQGLTVSGDLLGTRGYMSPEQTAGRSDIDFRTDEFSLGATLYQALTLELPYGKEAIGVTTPLPVAPSRAQRILSRDYDTVLLKTIEPARENRYETVRDFQEDWQRVRQGLLPRARPVSVLQRLRRWLLRNRWFATSAVLVLLVLALGWNVLPERPVRYDVELQTDPPGARGVLVPIDPDTGEFIPDRRILSYGDGIPLLLFDDVPPGDYWVEVEVEGHGFHEVFRRVPDLSAGEVPGQFYHQDWSVNRNTVRLHEIDIPGGAVVHGMTYYAGDPAFEAGFPEPMPSALRRHIRPIAPFYMDPLEVTVGACQQVGGRHEFEELDPDQPMCIVSFDEAVEYAEKMGKRLPTEFEYEFAASSRGTSEFPWGNDRTLLTVDSFGLAAENAHDLTDTIPPVRGLFSGLVEWTVSFPLPYPAVGPEGLEFYRAANPGYRLERIVRGGTYSVADIGIVMNEQELQLGPRYRHSVLTTLRYPGIGFRCVRSAGPRFADAPVSH